MGLFFWQPPTASRLDAHLVFFFFPTIYLPVDDGLFPYALKSPSSGWKLS